MLGRTTIRILYGACQPQSVREAETPSAQPQDREAPGGVRAARRLRERADGPRTPHRAAQIRPQSRGVIHAERRRSPRREVPRARQPPAPRARGAGARPRRLLRRGVASRPGSSVSSRSAGGRSAMKYRPPSTGAARIGSPAGVEASIACTAPSSADAAAARRHERPPRCVHRRVLVHVQPPQRVRSEARRQHAQRAGQHRARGRPSRRRAALGHARLHDRQQPAPMAARSRGRRSPPS